MLYQLENGLGIVVVSPYLLIKKFGSIFYMYMYLFYKA